jgi:hypothetical protein
VYFEKILGGNFYPKGSWTKAITKIRSTLSYCLLGVGSYPNNALILRHYPYMINFSLHQGKFIHLKKKPIGYQFHCQSNTSNYQFGWFFKNK